MMHCFINNKLLVYVIRGIKLVSHPAYKQLESDISRQSSLAAYQKTTSCSWSSFKYS